MKLLLQLTFSSVSTSISPFMFPFLSESLLFESSALDVVVALATFCLTTVGVTNGVSVVSLGSS